MNIKFGENKTIEITGKRIRGFKVNLFMSSNTANTAQVQADSVPDNISVKAILYRKGQTMQLFQDSLRTCHMALNVEKNVFDLCAVGGTIVADTLLAAAPGVKEQRLWSYVLDMGSVYDLTENGDRIEFTLNALTSGVSAAVDTAVSYFDIDGISAEGDEHFTRILVTHSVSANESRWTRSFHEGNVKKMILVNTDATDVTSANALIDNVDITGEGKTSFSTSLVHLDLLSKNREMYEVKAEFDKRLATMIVYEGHEGIDNARFNVLFVKANVNGGKNTLCALVDTLDIDQFHRADAKSNLHNLNTAVKKGLVSHASAMPHIAVHEAKKAKHTKKA